MNLAQTSAERRDAKKVITDGVVFEHPARPGQSARRTRKFTECIDTGLSAVHIRRGLTLDDIITYLTADRQPPGSPDPGFQYDLAIFDDLECIVAVVHFRGGDAFATRFNEDGNIVTQAAPLQEQRASVSDGADPGIEPMQAGSDSPEALLADVIRELVASVHRAKASEDEAYRRLADSEDRLSYQAALATDARFEYAPRVWEWERVCAIASAAHSVAARHLAESIIYACGRIEDYRPETLKKLKREEDDWEPVALELDGDYYVVTQNPETDEFDPVLSIVSAGSFRSCRTVPAWPTQTAARATSTILPE